MAKLEYIFFDLGNVLLNFSHQQACRQIGELVGSEPQAIWELIFETRLIRDYDRGEIDAREFHRQFTAAIDSRLPLDRFLNAFDDIFSANESVVSLVKELEKIGFAKGILSNTCESHWSFVTTKYPFISSLFAEHVLSFEVGFSKPDQEIYRAAIERSRVEADRIFFVDDRIENVQAAIEVGIQGVLFESEQQLRQALVDREVPINLR